MQASEKLDFLFVFPFVGNSYAQTVVPERLSEDIPNQESPNIGVGYLAAVAKKAGYKVGFIDMVFDNFTVDDLIEHIKIRKPSFVGFTAFTVHIKSAGAIAEKIKSEFPSISTCVGGPHASAMPIETLAEFPGFDFVIVGEAEETFTRIIDTGGDEKELSNIKGIATRRSPTFVWNGTDNVEDLPFPAWEDFDLPRYGGLYPHRTARELPMLAHRGCPYKCNFCMRASGEQVRARSVKSVIAEIEHNIEAFGCESIAFLDETFALNVKWTKEFFAALKNRGLNKKITWSCSTRVSHTTEELFYAMRDAGCYYTFFGLESANPQVLEKVGKKITTEDMLRTIKWARQAGILPVGAFIIGLVDDNEASVYQAIELAKELNLFSVTFPIAVPFPGTELRQLAIENKHGLKILSNDWDQYGKQDGGVMESDVLSWKRRKELQEIAYETHPKKDLNTYLESLQGLGRSA